jgi:hypothetical protein
MPKGFLLTNPCYLYFTDGKTESWTNLTLDCSYGFLPESYLPVTTSPLVKEKLDPHLDLLCLDLSLLLSFLWV